MLSVSLVADMFKTDSEISRCNGPAGSKELQPFHFDEGVDGTSDYFHDSQVSLLYISRCLFYIAHTMYVCIMVVAVWYICNIVHV